MQINGELASVIGILSSIGAAFVAYGIMREKIRNLEKDFEDLISEQKNYVTMKHFDAVIEPVKTSIAVIQKDIKEILRAVSEHSPRRHN